jgi:hypothetical protein
MSGLALATTTGCGEASGQGTLRLTVYGESFIEDGIPADALVDGWRIDFSRFVVGLGDLDVDGEAVGEQFVADLTVATGGAGQLLTEVPVPAGVVEQVAYHLVVPGPDAHAADPDDDTVAWLRDGGFAMYVEGTASRGDETIAFAWGFPTGGHFDDCRTDQTVTDGGTAVSQLTIHADHLLYDDLDSEAPNIAFDLIAAADADADAVVTEAELRAVDITTQARYQVGSRDIRDLWGFIEAQTATVGHIDGEGHCGEE